MTISSYATSKSALFRMSLASIRYPLVRKRNERSTRAGVFSRPSRLGSSPIFVRIDRISSIIQASIALIVSDVVPRSCRPLEAADESLGIERLHQVIRSPNRHNLGRIEKLGITRHQNDR